MALFVFLTPGVIAALTATVIWDGSIGWAVFGGFLLGLATITVPLVLATNTSEKREKFLRSLADKKGTM